MKNTILILLFLAGACYYLHAVSKVNDERMDKYEKQLDAEIQESQVLYEQLR